MDGRAKMPLLKTARENPFVGLMITAVRLPMGCGMEAVAERSAARSVQPELMPMAK